MSVALSLAALRASNPTDAKRPPSLLHSPAQAAKIPLVEQASLASNSLTLLSTIDQALPSFVEPLFLQKPISRQTLDSIAQAALSESVIDVARHLAPLFPIQHAQRVYEWFINALHAGLLAPDAEVDALLISALPFHATPQFAPFVAALLLSRPHPRWAWLRPVAEQRKSPSLDFLVSRSTHIVHILAVEWALSLAQRAIPATSACVFIGNVTARWISSASLADRRNVLLKALVALEEAIKLPAKQPTELASAVLAIAAAAVVAGVDDDVVPVIGRCAVKALRKGNESVQTTALGCLAVLVKRYGESSLTRTSALRFLGADVVDGLKQLGSFGKDIYGMAIVCAMGEGLPDQKHLEGIQVAIAGEGSQFVRSGCITKLVCGLLDRIAKSLKAEDDPAASAAKLKRQSGNTLALLLAPLAKGEFAAAVDEGIRSHFNARRNNETMSEEISDVINDLLATCMQGTTYEVMNWKKKKGKDFSIPSLLIALSHPADSVRELALQHLPTPSTLKEDKRDAFAEKVLNMLIIESRLSLVTSACTAARALVVTEQQNVLRIFSKRFVELVSSSTLKGGEVQHTLQRAADELIECCLWANSIDVSLPLMSAVATSGIFDLPAFSDHHEKIRDNMAKLFLENGGISQEDIQRLRDGPKLKDGVGSVVSKLCLIEMKHANFLDEVSSLRSEWALEVVSGWVSHASSVHSTELNASCSGAMMTCFKNLLSNEDSAWDRKKPFVKRICKILLSRKIKRELQQERATAIWEIALNVMDDVVIQFIVLQLISIQEVSRCLKMMSKIIRRSDIIDLRVRTLKWFFYLSRGTTSTEHQEEAVRVMLLALYSQNRLVREEAFRLCRGAVEESAKDEAPTHVDSLQRVIHSLPLLLSEKELGSTVRTNVFSLLQSHVLRHFRDVHEIPVPFRYSYADSEPLTGICNRIFSEFDYDQKQPDLLPMMRAMQGSGAGSKADLKLHLEKRLLPQLKDISRNGVTSNSVEMLALHISYFAVSSPQLWTDSLTGILSKIGKLSLTVSDVPEKNRAQSNSDPPKSAFFEEKRHMSELLQSCIMVLFSVLLKYGNHGKEDMVSHLLVWSTQSSDLGTLSRRLLDNLIGGGTSLSNMASRLQSLTGVFREERKKKRSSASRWKKYDEALGALETVHRWVNICVTDADDLPSGIITTLKTPLWEFLTTVIIKAKQEEITIEAEVEYKLQLCLDSLCGLYRRSCDKSDDLARFDILLEAAFYPGRNVDVIETALIVNIRKSALQLIEILAPVFGEALRHVAVPLVNKLITEKNSKRAFTSLRALVPCMLSGGCSFEELSVSFCTACYGRKISQRERDQIRALISSTCKSVVHVKDGVQLCLEKMQEISSAVLSPEDLASESQLLLEEVDLEVTSIFEIISATEEKFRSYLASAVLTSPGFNEKLSKVMADNVTDSFIVHIANMFVSLLDLHSSDTQEHATGVTMALFPLPGLSHCINTALAHPRARVRSRAISFLSKRLDETESPIRHTWKIPDPNQPVDEKAVKKAQSSAVDGIGQSLCTIIVAKHNEDNDMVQMTQSAINALERLVFQFGPSSTKAVVSLAEKQLVVMEALRSTVESNQSGVSDTARLLLAAHLNCLASSVTSLRSAAVSFIPQSLDISISVMNAAFVMSGKDDMSKESLKLAVLLTEGAVRLCHSVIESAPSLFGHRALKKLACLGTKCSTVVVEDLLTVAVEKIPSNSCITAMSNTASALSESEASTSGVSLLLNVLRKACVSFPANKLRSHASVMLSICTKSMEYGRESKRVEELLKGISPSKDTEGEKEKEDDEQDKFSRWMEDCKTVDESCAETLCTMVLRLPEVEFKKMFESLDGWARSCILTEDMEMLLPESEGDTVRLVIRTLTFYRIIQKLFMELHSILVPYFFQLLDKVLIMASFKRDLLVTEDKKGVKKRKRQNVQEDEKRSVLERYNAICEETQDVSVECLTLMLKQNASTSMLNVETISRIQGAVLCYFDVNEGDTDQTARCLSALASRIVAMGNEAESKDESRSMLNALARELLLRTQEKMEIVREGALVVSEAIANAIGDEYLVTLPESMPVLAEVIDDECDAVRKAAKSFVGVMGTLAGEPILEQLK